MEAAAPALLSGLAEKLLRRPPSLRELVTLVGYADDYAWFVGLVRRLFPDEAEAALSAPDVRTRVERFANLFGERHFPLYAPFIEFWTEDEGEQPPWSWMRQGIPFDLMGFGYDGLHELWHGYREGISALVLLARPADAYYDGPDGIRTAWLESAAERIPQGDPATDSPGRHTAGGPDRGAEGDAVRGGGARQPPGSSPRPATSSSTIPTRMGTTTASADPWEDEIIAEGTEEWRKGQRPHGLGVQAGRLAGGGPPRPLRRDAGLRPAAAPQTRTGGKRP